MTKRKRSQALLDGTRSLYAYGASFLTGRNVAILVAIAVLAVVIPVKMALLSPLFFGATDQDQRIELTYVENGIGPDIRIPRGLLFDSLVINLPWTSTVTADATAVRTRGTPVKLVQFLGDGNKIYHTVKPQDSIRMTEVFERSPLAQILTSPSGVTAAGGPYVGIVKLTVPFVMKSAYNGHLTALASWILSKDPTLRITWGSHAEVFRGGTGSTAVTAGAGFVMLTAIGGTNMAGLTAMQYASILGNKVESFDEKTYTAASPTTGTKQDLPNTADIRAVCIFVDDTNGDPLTEIEMAKLSFDFMENTVTRTQAGVNLGVLRARNVRNFGLAAGMPPGMAVLDFASDKDITQSLYPATKKNLVQLVYFYPAPAAGTYTIRTHTIGIEPGRAVTAVA